MSRLIEHTFMYIYQSKEMKVSIALFSTFHACKDVFVLVELSLCDQHVNLDNVLPDDPAGANVEVPVHNVVNKKQTCILNINVPDLRVSHETIAQANHVPMSIECLVCIFFGDGIHVGGISSLDGISFDSLLWCDSPAIMDTFK